MLEKIRNFYEREYNDTVRFLTTGLGSAYKSKGDYVYGAIEYCLGVAFFAQEELGIKFEDIDPLYNEYREKLENLLTK